MGKIIKLDPRKKRRANRWARPKRRRYARIKQPKFNYGRPSKVKHALFLGLPYFLGTLLLGSGALFLGSGVMDPPSWMMGEPQLVNGDFSRCGIGRNHHCVIDGDTFKIGERKIRIVGIDTAEMDARCPAEASLAQAATDRLQSWLNEGEFTMRGRLDRPNDRYGRALLTIERVASDGSVERLADVMREEGLARRYSGGWRRSWCD